MIIRLILALYFTTAQNVTVNRIPSTGTPPERRLYAQSVYLQGKLYYFGGQNAGGDIMNQLHIFHVDTELWDIIEPIDDFSPDGRMLFAMYASDSEIFVHGGIGPYGKLKDLWSYDPVENIWRKNEQYGDVPPPFHRVGFTDFSYENDKYFAIGWFSTIGNLYTNDIYLYNTSTQTWRKMPKTAKSGHSVPKPSRLCTLKYHMGFIYQWGGDLEDKNDPTAALLYRYDLTSEAWEVVNVSGNQPQARSFFGSGLSDDTLYVFAGWVGAWGKDVDQTMRLDLSKIGNTENLKWEELQIQQIADYSTYIPRDSYAYHLIENKFYIQGGYSSHGLLGNYLLKLDLDQSPIGLTVLNPNVDIPTKRFFSTLTCISGKFYMFGGSTGTKELDELWVYNEDQGTWSLQDSIGVRPKARQGHSAVALGDSLIIWGGKNGGEYYQDLHLYNTLTNIWEVVEVKSTVYPSGGEGACMEVYNEDLYIFGGKNDFSANNHLWKFNLGPNEYTKLSGDRRFYSPPALAYSTWYTIEDKMYIMYGVMNDTGSPYTIHIFDFATQMFTESDLTLTVSLSNVASGKAGTSIIIANGSQWNTRAMKDVYVLNMASNNIEAVAELDWLTFAEASVYYKNSLYVFGGGDAEEDGSVRRSRSVNRFYKINFPELPCSQGTYPDDNQCISCPLGTYKDSYEPTLCREWLEGTYNDKIGASNITACIPWPAGTFNSKIGQSFCLKCHASDICPVGTVQPTAKIVHGNQYSQIQPNIHETLRDTAQHWSLKSLMFMNLGLALIILGIIFRRELRQWIRKQDMFLDMHNYEENQVMKTRRTLIGGITSIIVYGSIVFLTIQSLLYFFFDNIEETKSLIPIVVVNEFYDTIKGTINIKVTFNEYRGQCVTEENEWMREITYTKSNMKGSFSNLSCKAEGNQCLVELTCHNCVLDNSAQVMFSSYEISSQATSINVAVSSESSVPDFDSQISITQSVESGGVFVGPEPTVFHFMAIPSVYESEVEKEEDQQTGYHLALGDSSTIGSSYTVENLTKTRFLHTQINFSQGYSALQTKRAYKIRTDVLIIGIIGGVAGVVELAAMAMGFIEDKYEKCMKPWKEKEEKIQELHPRQLTKQFSEPNRPMGAIERFPTDDTLSKKRNHIRSNQKIIQDMSEFDGYRPTEAVPDDDYITPNISFKKTERLPISDYESYDLDHEEISVVVIPV